MKNMDPITSVFNLRAGVVHFVLTPWGSQLDALGRPADLSQRLKGPSAFRTEAARELEALKQARRECEDATAAY